MSTLKRKKLYGIQEIPEENHKSQGINSSEIDPSSIPDFKQSKSTITTRSKKREYGPCDTFNYDFRTKQIWYNLIEPVINFAMKFGWRFKTEGLENVPKQSNYVIMPNHVSHFDTFLAVVPLAPRKAPNVIADEKLFYNKFLSMFAKKLNAFPVRKGTKNMNIVKYAIKRVKNGDSMLWYPEGQRHKLPWINKCNTGKLGGGMIAYKVKAPIIPCFINGSEFAMPVGKKISWGYGPRSIKILVKYGKPVPLDDLRKLPSSPETSKLVIDRIIEHIDDLRSDEPYQIQKTKKNQSYAHAKKRLFESSKYEKDYKIIK